MLQALLWTIILRGAAAAFLVHTEKVLPQNLYIIVTTVGSDIGEPLMRWLRLAGGLRRGKWE